MSQTTNRLVACLFLFACASGFVVWKLTNLSSPVIVIDKSVPIIRPEVLRLSSENPTHYHYKDNVSETIPYEENGKWGLSTVSGVRICDPFLDFIDSRSDSGLRLARTDGRWGFIDSSGRWAIAPQFCLASPFSEGLAAVKGGKCLKFGYINTNGQYVFPEQFDYAEDFTNGTAYVYYATVLDIVYGSISDSASPSRKIRIDVDGKLVK